MTILILEDNQEKLQEIVNVLLNEKEVNVADITNASDATNARRLLRANHYDMIILDIVVPSILGMAPSESAGVEMIEDLFSDPSIKIPSRVIGLTQYSEIAQNLKNDFFTHGLVLLTYISGDSSWHQPLLSQIKLEKNSRVSESDNTVCYDYCLGVICALEIEFFAVKNLGWDFKEKQIKGDPTLYIDGNIELNGKNFKVIVAYCGRMGMSAASITAMKIIQNFRPKIIAITGITGAVRGNANIGDVIIAEQVWDWGMGKWIMEDKQVKFLPSPHHISLDVDLRSAALRISHNTTLLSIIRENYVGAKPETTLKIVIGPVASGSAVISTQSMTDHIRLQHRKLIGIEMESYGLYAAASECSSPRPKFISIKSASDFADDQKNDNYHHYCSYTSAEVLKQLVILLIPDLE